MLLNILELFLWFNIKLNLGSSQDYYEVAHCGNLCMAAGQRCRVLIPLLKLKNLVFLNIPSENYYDQTVFNESQFTEVCSVWQPGVTRLRLAVAEVQ